MRTQTIQTSDAVGSIRDDHRRILDLFGRFETQQDYVSKKEIAREALDELEVHTFAEEQVLYPFCRRELGLEGQVVEATEAHHVAKLLIAELRLTPAGPHHVAKFELLMDAVKEHMKVEERDILSRLEASDIDQRDLAARLDMARSAGRLKPSPVSLGLIGLGVAAAAAAYYLFSRRRG